MVEVVPDLEVLTGEALEVPVEEDGLSQKMAWAALAARSRSGLGTMPKPITAAPATTAIAAA